jgi:Zn-dependent protease/CBS domain-containing protein
VFKHRLTLFKILGFPIKVDASWLLLALLITWSLAHYFPLKHPGLSGSTYWLMGLAGALGLFVSIIFHELCHSLVAKQYGLPMGSITLFIFGGVAEMEEEPKTPKIEFWMAIAGPLSSIFLGIVFFWIAFYSKAAHLGIPITIVTGYLSTINIILALFNMVPAFPLDGGRVLRAILWSIKGNLRWATRISSNVGSIFGAILIVLGVLAIISGQFIAGLWWILIGTFLRRAASASYQQLLIRRQLEGFPVSQFLRHQPVTVPPDMTLDRLINEYFYHYYFKAFPVVDAGQLLGIISMDKIKQYPREEWSHLTVREAMTPPSSENSISSTADAMDALALLNRTKSSRLLVVDSNHQLLGILSLKDLLQLLSMKIDLEASS